VQDGYSDKKDKTLNVYNSIF